MKKEWNKYFLFFSLIILFIIIAKITGFMSITNIETQQIDALGNIRTEQRIFLPMAYSSDYTACVVDDNDYALCEYIHKCSSGTGYCLMTVQRTFGSMGWAQAKSCVGYMEYNGCDSSSCSLKNKGKCTGQIGDSNTIECDGNSDCKYDEYCSVGECKLNQACREGKYYCENAYIYRCDKQSFKPISDCYTATGINGCKTSKGKKDWRDVCKTQCEKNSDCNIETGYVCSSGRCVSSNTGQQETGLLKKQKCVAEGKLWIDKKCEDIPPKTPTIPPKTPTIEPPNLDDTCTSDFYTSCKYQEPIIYAKCIDGEYTKTDEKCMFSISYILKNYKRYVIFGGVLIILTLFYFLVFNKKNNNIVW